MRLFMPAEVYIDPRCNRYEETERIKALFRLEGIPIKETRKVEISGSIPEKYSRSKKTIYLTVNKQKKLRPCKPSADYQFSLSSSCPGNCEYCYLQTTQGETPFMKLFVNIQEILGVLDDYIEKGKPNITSFESGSITDPVALEHLTGNLKSCIEYFAENDYGLLRVITKYDNVDSFTSIKHNKHTKFRFSINSRYVINNFEHGTTSFEERILASKKIAKAGYPLGFIIAPIMIYDGWKEEYKELLDKLYEEIKDYNDEITFELIQHRYTLAAKELITKRFPGTKLHMKEEERKQKWGPYGKFKFVYPKERSEEIKEYLTSLISERFLNGRIEYFT